jgi:acetyl esterase/lipase
MVIGTALQFMLTLNFERFSNSTVSEISLQPIGNLDRQPDRVFQANIYRRAGGQSRGVILIVHGMTVTGNRDPRIINLAQALAQVGYTAIAPLIPAIQDQQLHPGTWQDIAAIIARISADRELCPQGRLALMGPSFSGSACLIAAALPENHERLSAICTIGAYAEVHSVFDFFFRSNEPDEYGKTIVLWNFVEYAIGKNKAVLEALKLATLDNGHRRKPGECQLPAYLDQMKPKDRAIFERLRYDGEYRLELWENKISKHPTLAGWVREMQAADNLQTGMAPVTLIHGRADDVIPPEQSLMLYRRLQELGVPVRLCVTDLISHGDHGLSLRMIPEAVRLASAFGFFFRHI